MNLNSLISMPVKKAESLLTAAGINYTIKEIKTFKLGSSDTAAVVKAGRKPDGVVLYVCKFQCGAGEQ